MSADTDTRAILMALAFARERYHKEVAALRGQLQWLAGAGVRLLLQGLVAWLLWNWTVPDLLGRPTATYPQVVAVILLLRVLR